MDLRDSFAMDIEQEPMNPIPLLSTQLPNELNNESTLPMVSDRPSTPDKCAVCLNNKQMDIIARIDSCAHTFCFACILEWSKVRAICPLCKQAFKLITRERYSGEIVEEIRVQNPPSNHPRRFNSLHDVLRWVDHQRREEPHTMLLPRHRSQDLFRQMVYTEWLNTVQALVHRPTSNDGNTYLTPFVRGTNTISLTDFIPADSIRRRLSRYLRQTTSELRQITFDSQPIRQTIAFRKHIYLNRIFVRSPLMGQDGEASTTRECSPTWFASNPACLHRLVPFLARDLVALLWNDERTIEHIIQEVLTTIQIHEIRSIVLRRKLNEYLGRFTKHFLHEFYTYAACPYDLAGFDRHAQYPNSNVPVQETTPLQIQIDDDDNENNEEMPIIIDETNDLAISTIDLASSTSPSPATSTVPTNLESQRRTSSPECEIVEYVEANRERTPTLIVLSEDDDDDDDDEDEDEDNNTNDDEILQEDERETIQQNEMATSRKRKYHRHHRHAKRSTTSVSNQQRSPESVILDDEDEEHIEISNSQSERSSSPSYPINTTTSTTIYETDED